jgi:hypothetical protein
MDRDEQRVAMKKTLKDYASGVVPSDTDVWPAILARLSSPRATATRLVWSLAAFALLLVTSTTVLAANPSVVQRLWQQFKGLKATEEAGLVRGLDLNHSKDGYTVTLERAYADANQIVVAYSVEGPPEPRAFANATLVDSNGTTLRGVMGTGVTGSSDILGVSLPPGAGVQTEAFDASIVEGSPTALSLRLIVELVGLAERVTDSRPMVESVIAPKRLVEPFVFDFTVPFVQGKVVNVQQTVETEGVSITLERVTVTPSETTALVRFDGSTSGLFTPVFFQTPDGRQVAAGYSTWQGDDAPRVFHAFESLVDLSGEWTFTLSTKERTAPVLDSDGRELSGFRTGKAVGPVTFRFQVP